MLEYWQIGKTVDCWTDSFDMSLWRNWRDASDLSSDGSDTIWVRLPVVTLISGCSSVGRARALGA
nr:MAG TPA: hypothetical protein [Caudoviricetes sp.]